MFVNTFFTSKPFEEMKKKVKNNNSSNSLAFGR